MSKRFRFVRKWGLRGALVLGLIAIIAVALLWWHARRSLPILDGEVVVSALGADVRIDRDANGVPTIYAHDRLDAARALGFLHAQDRLFGMDLNRRLGAGELSALLGKVSLGYDRWLRFFPNRALAEAAYATMAEEDRVLLDAYTEGVNTGINALDASPPEYLLPGAKVRPWQPEDCILVGLNMFYNLQDCRGQTDEERGLIREHFPKEVVDYLFTRTPRSDAPLDGSIGPDLEFPVEAWAAVLKATHDQSGDEGFADAAVPGSNAWAVGPSATTNGRAILANDMHLSLQVPHVWYRASVRYTARDGSPVAVDGPTLPGLPVWIVGSNRHVAWGFTNSYTDQTDLVEIEKHPDDENRYRTADGWATFTTRKEIIEVAAADPVAFEITETIWGPVREGMDGRAYAVIWMGAQRGFWNMSLEHMARAKTMDEAIFIAHQAAVPAQNCVVADRAGNTAWTLIGPLPDRHGIDGFFPLKPSAIKSGWSGLISPDRVPVIRKDRVWSANQRAVGGDDRALIGDGGYDVGYRASRIRDQLAGEALDEPAMLALQGDIRAEYLLPWRDHFLSVLDADAIAENDDRERLRDAFANWDGRADAASGTYTLLRQSRGALIGTLRTHLSSPLGEHQRAFPPSSGIAFDEIVLDCLTAPHDALAPAKYGTMRSLTLRVLDSAAGFEGTAQPWGQANALRMRHPILGGVPLIGDLFSMPSSPQSGDAYTVRVLRPAFGSSERMVVSPGHEEDGFYHQPGGASGHFLSPFFRSGHQDWVELAPSPFLPGKTEHRLDLKTAN